jgi:hypothetical protein
MVIRPYTRTYLYPQWYRCVLRAPFHDHTAEYIYHGAEDEPPSLPCCLGERGMSESEM